METAPFAAVKGSPYQRARPRSKGARSPRQRALSQWRGVDLEPLEVARSDSARTSARVLPKVMDDLRMDRHQSDAEIVRVWNHLLDPNIITHAQPTGLRKGTLFVSVDSSVWLSELVRYRRKEILDRLQHSFGSGLITRISFRVG